jgi:peptidoglycan/LPS O-acetylase OafA/YrhL
VGPVRSGTGRIPSLDGLRAISIGLVLFGHLCGTLLPKRLAVAATFGVTIFFVISGFLITGLLVAEQERSGRISLRQFYTRRVLRIFPAFYFFLGSALILRKLGLVTFSLGDLEAAATFTMNYRQDHAWTLGHLWSLAVEEQFYLLWPATLALFGLARGARAALAGIIAAPLVRIAIFLFVPAWREGIESAFPTVADALATGCLLALMRRRLDASPRYLKFLASPSFVVVPVIVFLTVTLTRHTRFDYLIGQSLRNLGIGLIIDRVVRFPTMPVAQLLNATPMAFVGTLSYSLYLWQQPVINRQGHLWIHRFPQNVLLAAGAALVSYFLVERPVLAWRDRVRGRVRAPVPVAPA